MGSGRWKWGAQKRIVCVEKTSSFKQSSHSFNAKYKTRLKCMKEELW